ncbi:MAG: hypothetical protein AAF725_17585 [Acidobacteriota bacterium]
MRRAQTRNPIGNVLAARRAELQMPRARFRRGQRLAAIEFTAKTARAVNLIGLEGSDEFLEPLGFSQQDLKMLADGEISEEEALERARLKTASAASAP